MRKQSNLLGVLSLCAVAAGCSGDDSPGTSNQGLGGATPSGTATGGANAVGGGFAAGGAVASGGAGMAGTSTGGMTTVVTGTTSGGAAAGGSTSGTISTATGGTSTTTGGTTAKGGSTSTGGTTAKGGSTSTGGATGTGGTAAKGGSTSTGGTTAKGGSTSTGGTTAKGGSTSTGGTTAKGGSTSTGGTSTVVKDPSWTVDGYAATGSGTTGGGNVTPTTVTTCAALKTALESTAAAVVRIPSGTTLDCRLNPTTATACRIACTGSNDVTTYIDRVPVTGQTCADLGGVAETNTITRYDYSINVKSNKTLQGLGSGATIRGASLTLSSVSNVIIQNIALKDINAALIEAGDGLTINSSNHVFINHCEFSMISDGYMDVRYDSSAITVSYNLMDGVAATHHDCSGQHNFISMVAEQSYVSYHHNYFSHGGGRNPKVGGTSNVHLYNNYYDTISYFCANVGAGSQILVENNSYYNARYPHWADGGIVEATGNVYTGTTTASGTGRDNNGNAFTPPYTYTLDAAAGLNTTIPQKAGLGTLP